MEPLTTEVSLTVSGPAYAFLAMSVLPILAGKMLQQGGVQFARGGHWAFETALGGLVLSAPFLISVLLLIFAAFNGGGS
ncbi:hypothetical protein [Marivita sp.]|uniref:hypothetical protein n=1 Tax=Marivita sp. TaxID=2003365 RepID=UPI003F71669D